MKYYIVDAFSQEVFKGNPAAVCVMESWLSDDVMLNIAKENNLSETAFTVKENDRYHIRWFTPAGEIDLCGHATLATAYVISNFYEQGCDTITFDSQSGPLSVQKKDDLFELDFPSIMPEKHPITLQLIKTMGFEPAEAYLGRDLMLVLKSEAQVSKLMPNYSKLEELADGLGVIITAKGDSVDFVSRAFYPKLGIKEDPVTGSAHSNLIPYWSKKLGKKEMVAKQLSRRGGTLYCVDNDNRVLISGHATLYSMGKIFL